MLTLAASTGATMVNFSMTQGHDKCVTLCHPGSWSSHHADPWGLDQIH